MVDILIEAVIGVGGVIVMFLAGVWVGREFKSFHEFAAYFIERFQPKKEKCDNLGCVEGEILHLGESHENISWVDCPVCEGTGEKSIL